MLMFYFIISFVIVTNSLPPKIRYQPPIKQRRSFDFVQIGHDRDLWTNILSPNVLEFQLNGDNVTPDFSNGLEYPDPLLLLGPVAERAARILYRRPLFFGDINHVELLLWNQRMRKLNGLGPNNLGSIRLYSPFYRFNNMYLHK